LALEVAEKKRREPWLEEAIARRRSPDDRQVTKRSAEFVPPEPRGLRGRGGERPLSKCQSERRAADSRKRDSEMTSGEFWLDDLYVS
jgi:hypothetical protein